ncbi:hypothetical protein ACIQU4_25585 [Streptomyces sp. NPDC090741]|uniref:hypothetical protein n=1 Tax=Streptomyces sp. NPDC090741 TaxID=3365967 RepID=UPI00382D29DA
MRRVICRSISSDGKEELKSEATETPEGAARFRVSPAPAPVPVPLTSPPEPAADELVHEPVAQRVIPSQGRDPSRRSREPNGILKRTLGSFQVFATSFAFISVAVGIFATFGEVLRTAGPVGIWLWIVVAVGQTLAALVVAQFAARIPLSGSSYRCHRRRDRVPNFVR